MTAAMKLQGSCLQCFLWLVTALLGPLPQAASQTLHATRLDNGSELIVVGVALAEATTVAWPGPASAEGGPRVVTAGELTFVAELEAALTAAAGDPPPVIIVTGAALPGVVRSTVERALGGVAPTPLPTLASRGLEEGRTERRLGPPGSDAELRLEVALPPPGDPQRTPVEVLWELMPELLDLRLAGLRTRVDGDRGLLEARVDAAAVDPTLSRLRLGLARVAEEPRLQDAMVEAAARRLAVRRRAILEEHPAGALHLLSLWRAGGAAAVREFLFAGDGVTGATVRDAARRWLPRHPGAAIVILPPQVFDPRFATPPQILTLDSGMSAAILERDATALAVVCLRPVVVPDLDNGAAAAVLTRIAQGLRAGAERPGWVEVRAAPPQLELAGAPDRFAELLEALRSATLWVAEDPRPVTRPVDDSRRRALSLMAGLLGVAEGAELSPAALLRPDNLALGAVAVDGEAAAEALVKIWPGGDAELTATVRQLAAVPRTREAVPGSMSTLVTALDLAIVPGEAEAAVLAELLAGRLAALLTDHSTEVLAPFVPGRRVLLVVVTAAAPLDALEGRFTKRWRELTAPVGEEELAAVRRRTAAEGVARGSGAMGHARRCAAVAVGAARWQPAAEEERAALAVTVEELNRVLRAVGPWDALQSTAAGVLPVARTGPRER